MGDAYVDSQGVVHEANVETASGPAYADAQGNIHPANVSIPSSSGGGSSGPDSEYGKGIDWASSSGGGSSTPKPTAKAPTKPIVTVTKTSTGNTVKTVKTPDTSRPTTMTQGRGGTRIVTPVNIQTTVYSSTGEVIQRKRGRGTVTTQDNKTVTATNLTQRRRKPIGGEFTGAQDKGKTLRDVRNIVGVKFGKMLAPLVRDVTGKPSPSGGVAFVKAATFNFLAPNVVLSPSEEVVAAGIGGSLANMAVSNFFISEAAGGASRWLQSKRQTTFVPNPEVGGTAQFVTKTEEGFNVRGITKQKGVVISELPGGFNQKTIPVKVTAKVNADVVPAEFGVVKGTKGRGGYSTVTVAEKTETTKAFTQVTAGELKFSAKNVAETDIIGIDQKVFGERITHFDIETGGGFQSTAKVKQTFVKVPGGEVSETFGAAGSGKNVRVVQGRAVSVSEPIGPPFSESSLNVGNLPAARPGGVRVPVGQASQAKSLGAMQVPTVGEVLAERAAISAGQANLLESGTSFSNDLAKITTTIGRGGVALTSKRSDVTAPLSLPLDTHLGVSTGKEITKNIQTPVISTKLTEVFGTGSKSRQKGSTIEAFTQKQSMGQVSDISQLIETDFIQEQKTGQAQIMKSPQITTGDFTPISPLIPSFVDVGIPISPKVGAFKMPSFNFNFAGGGKTKRRKTRARSKYTPSLGAVLLNIKGSKLKGKLFGFELRPKSGGWF